MLHKKAGAPVIPSMHKITAIYKDIYKNVDDLDEELQNSLALEEFFRTPKILLYKDLMGQIYYKEIRPE